MTARKRRWAGAAPGSVVVLATLVACGGTDETRATNEAPAGPTASSSPATSSDTGGAATDSRSSSPGSDEASDRKGLRLTTGPSDFGTMLFDGRGQAIYLFDKESTPKPRCYGDCAVAWPPVLTDGEPRAAGRVRSALLGTVLRRDGSTQVTYDGRPLYFYAHERPGQVLCHGIDEFGGLWLVVTPSGAPAPA